MQGRITNVIDHRFGSELGAAASASDTTITVLDVDEFSFDGGTLLLVDGVTSELVSYTIDEDSDGVIALDSALVNSYAAETPVYVYPASIERRAFILADGQEEELEARVPLRWRDVIDLGSRPDDETAEVVEAGQIDGELVILDVIGSELSVDGGWIDLDTISSAPESILLDDFNRADGAIGGYWEAFGPSVLPDIDDNAVTSTAGEKQAAWPVEGQRFAAFTLREDLTPGDVSHPLSYIELFDGNIGFGVIQEFTGDYSDTPAPGMAGLDIYGFGFNDQETLIPMLHDGDQYGIGYRDETMEIWVKRVGGSWNLVYTRDDPGGAAWASSDRVKFWAYPYARLDDFRGTVGTPIPDPTDGVPPASSPTPTLRAGIGSIVVSYDPVANADPVTYEIHVGTSSGFTASGATLVGEIDGTLLFVRSEPDDDPLDYATGYYVRVIAKDADGAASSSSAAGPISPARVTTPDLTDLAVTEAKVNALAITTAKLAADAVTAAQLADDAVGTEHLQALAVTAAEIAANAITTAKIADDAVTSAELADAAVIAAKLDVSIGGGNFVLESSFEDAAYFSSVWVGSMDSTYATLARQTTEKYHGGAAAKITLNDVAGLEGAGGANYDHYATIKAATVVPPNNGAWTASVWIKAPAGRTVGLSVYRVTEGGTLYPWSPGYDPAGDAAAMYDWRAASGGWERFTVTLDPYAGSQTTSNMHIRAGFEGYAGGGHVNGDIAYVDAFQVESGDVATAYAPKPDEITAGTITATEIADNAVTTPKLIANAVTAAKIAADTITANEIAANAIGTTELNALAVTAAKIAANTITAAQIAAGTITATEIAALTITASQIAAGTITAAKIATDTITANEIAANAITTSEIAANTIQAGDIASHTISAAEIAALTITASEIAAGTITAAKIATDTITANEIATDAITANEIAANAVTVNEILANTITAAKLDVADVQAAVVTAAAVSALTITGATIRSASSDPRTQMDSSGFHVRDSGGADEMLIDSSGMRIRVGAANPPSATRRIDWVDGSGNVYASMYAYDAGADSESYWYARTYNQSSAALLGWLAIAGGNGLTFGHGSDSIPLLGAPSSGVFPAAFPKNYSGGSASVFDRRINRGTFSIVVGAADNANSAAIAHGLATTPVAVVACVDRTQNAGSNKWNATVGTVGATTFDVGVRSTDASNAGGTISGYWIAMS